MFTRHRDVVFGKVGVPPASLGAEDSVATVYDVTIICILNSELMGN